MFLITGADALNLGRRIGASGRMPYRIFAYLSPRALGDFVLLSMFASSVAELFDDSELTIYYRDDRPYKPMIASCIRNAKRVLTPSDTMPMLPVELFDPLSGAPKMPPDLATLDIRSPDLFLTQSVFREGMLTSLPLMPLAPPPETIDSSDKALMELGLDPERWIATVYWREPGYGFRPKPKPGRDIANPEPYIAAIRHIVENLGGQVVRLGHETSTELPKLNGLIDLAKVPNTEWLQLYAVWISRFMLSSNSGPVSYGPAFNVPTVVTDQLTPLAVYRPHDYVVTQKFAVDGKIYQGLEALDAGLLFRYGADIEQAIMNTAEDLIAAVDEMHASTTNCIGWRGHPDPQPPAQRPNALTMPLPIAVRRDLLIPPSQRPKI
jgi:putative glycosyltransferase (TIGR04372 family)